MTAQIRDITFTSRDGLRLYGRHYRKVFDDGAARRPVLCLAGLTRNGRDFHDIALALSQTPDAPRDVYTLVRVGGGFRSGTAMRRTIRSASRCSMRSTS